MKKELCFFVNYLNHHQVLVADLLYEKLGSQFCFVATRPVEPAQMKGGIDFSNREYCIIAPKNNESREYALRLARESETCVFGADSLEYAIERAKHNPQGLSIERGERWLKHGIINVFSPAFLKWWFSYQKYFRKANFYRLCNSAYASSDMKKVHAYSDRCYKWGYFTKVDRQLAYKEVDSKSHQVNILWCARFISLKHPELAILLAKRLKDNKFDFHLDMIGEGMELNKIKSMVQSLNLTERVSFLGNLSNEQVYDQMYKHDIFLLTSDRNEGWGAVANEAMSNGCVLVGADEVGSIPYLVIDNVNGMIFKSCNIDSLYEKVLYLINNPKERERMSKAGMKSMREMWSPENASSSLLEFIESLHKKEIPSILYGPCSKA